VALRITN